MIYFEEVFFGDWFMRGALNQGLPVNTVISTASLVTVTASRPETLQETLQVADGLTDFAIESCGLQITRVQPVGRRHMLKALNPIYIVVCRKGGSV